HFTFEASEQGMHTFNAVLDTAGNESITATDAADGVSGQASLIVAPAAAHKFKVSGPKATPADQMVALTVTAFDKYAKLATGYPGTTHFDNSPGQDQLPPAYPFPAADQGRQTFTFSLDTLGKYKIKITDTADGHIHGNAQIKVTPAVASFK